MVHWRDIPGNPDAFEKLVQLLDSGEAIGFVGAGASAGLYPLWPELIEQLADEVIQRGEAKPSVKRIWLRQDALQAARQIREKLGEGEFAELIGRIFGPKKGLDGKRYTAVHAALARLGFASFVTTNYDPALSYAIRDESRDRSPEAFDWRHERVGRWLLGRPGTPDEFPVLHAHGRHDSATGIILDATDYRRVFGNDRYRLLFEQLWTRQQLVIVGFSLKEPWLRIMAEAAMDRAGTLRAGERRHFAVLGIAVDDLEEEEDVRALRSEVEEPYHLRALFYPVTRTAGPDGKEREDHSALAALLGDLHAARKKGKGPRTVPPPANPLSIWFQQVEDEQRHLDDGFNRPPELRLLEKAWVQVRVQASIEEAPKADQGHELLGRPTTLDDIVALPVGEPAWNQGRWLLEGPPGSGKTTLLRHLAARLAREASPSSVPVFVSLPRLVESRQGLLEFAADGLDLARKQGVHDALALAGREGRLVLLLDSFDEVPRERRHRVLRLLGQLRRYAAWSSCKMVVSSRPIGRGGALGELPGLTLLPLDEGRRLEFLEAWFHYAGRGDWRGEARATLDYFGRHRGLRELSGNPLYLTLLTSLRVHEKLPSPNLPELYDQVFELLLEGSYHEDPRPLPNQDAVLEALRHLAHGMTEDDRWAEPASKLESRLRPRRELCRRLGDVEAWRNDLRAFLRDVYERSQLLGPHDGLRGDWRFWHRTFREALTAESLYRQHEGGGLESLTAWAEKLEEGGEGRWAEPLALLTGRLEDPDGLILRLADTNPKLAVRSAALAQGLKPDTIAATLQLTGDLEERAKAFEAIPDQLADAGACLALVEQLREGCRNGFDLFWLWWITEEIQRRTPHDPRPGQLLERFFDHIPPPEDPELLWTLDSPLDGRTKLWRRIPGGEGWVGSPDDEEDRNYWEGPLHKVKVLHPFWLGAVPVTNAQYAAFDPEKPFQQWEGVPEGELPDHPRVVTWYEAVSFCRWLATLPEFAGTAPRLPEEEEWEYACRARTRTPYWSGKSEMDLGRVGWYKDNEDKRTHWVGEKPANKWGLYDMHGNIWEWMASPFDTDRYKGRSSERPHPIDPAVPPADLAGSPRVMRVMRGGSCLNSDHVCRSAYRDLWDPWLGFGIRGFRVLLSSAPSRGSAVDPRS